MWNMRKRWILLGALIGILALLLTLVGSGGVQAGNLDTVDEAFTYQGRLRNDSGPVDGSCDFQFTLYDADTGGTQIGVTQTDLNVPVDNGLFTVKLSFPDAFRGEARWLQVAVRCPAGSGSYTTLYPRQEVTPAPYALTLRPGAEIRGESSFPLLFVHNLSSGIGVEGASDNSAGVVGQSEHYAGVMGLSSGTTTNAIGVYGQATAASGQTTGVYGTTASVNGTGVAGEALADSGDGMGVKGITNSASGTGVYGWAPDTAGSDGRPYGVYGYSGAGYGVYGYSMAASTNGKGLCGVAGATSGTTYGVWGESYSTNGRGVLGYAKATSGDTRGVWGLSDSTIGTGVYGSAGATSGTNYGVYGWSDSPSGYGGYFHGDLHTTGDLTVSGSKAFKIDHPLDPAHKYLYHFAQESPAVQNVYNGLVTLDADGEAVITLPEYFAALNATPYLYQLTPIGAPMPNLYVAQEIQDNTFRIAGGVPGAKVSWEVTAARADPYLRDHPAQTEQTKPAAEQDSYLYPQGYGQPPEKGVDYRHNAALFENAGE